VFCCALCLTAGLGDRQAGVKGFHFRQAIFLSDYCIGDLVKHLGTSTWAHGWPWAVLEGLGCRGDSRIDVCLLACCGGGVGGVGYRIEYLKGLSTDGIDELAANVVLDGTWQVFWDKVLAHVFYLLKW